MSFLMIAALAAASLNVGYHLFGRHALRLWKRRRRDRLVSGERPSAGLADWLLFPASAADGTVGDGRHALFIDDCQNEHDDRGYATMMAFFWPLKFATNVFVGTVLLGAKTFKIGTIGLVWLVAEAPVKALGRLTGRRPMPERRAVLAPPTPELREMEEQIDRDLDLDAKFRALEEAQKNKPGSDR